MTRCQPRRPATSYRSAADTFLRSIFVSRLLPARRVMSVPRIAELEARIAALEVENEALRRVASAAGVDTAAVTAAVAATTSIGDPAPAAAAAMVAAAQCCGHRGACTRKKL